MMRIISRKPQVKIQGGDFCVEAEGEIQHEQMFVFFLTFV